MQKYTFPSPVVLKVTGKDAVRYMNARLSNDVRALPVEGTCLAAALTAQGKTEALFVVLKLGESEFLLYCVGGDHQEVIAAFRRYIVADRVEVKEESWALHHVSSQEGFPALEAEKFLVHESAYLSLQPRLGTTGIDVLVPQGQSLPPQLLDAEELSYDEFEALRISHGNPSFPEELNNETLFPEAQFQEPIAFGKGCYVGQEVIEKVDAIGKLSKALRRIRVTGKLEVQKGSELRLSSTPTVVGKIITCSPLAVEGSRPCFATLKTSLPKDASLEVDGRQVTFEEKP